MLGEKIRVKGELEYTLRDAKTGKVEDHGFIHNDVTNLGWDLLADALAAPSGRPDVLSHMGIGWGTGSDDPFDAADTDLQGANKDRNAAVYSHTASSQELTMTGIWGANDPVPSGTITVNEVALFNAGSGGTMFDRVLTGGIAKTPSQELELRIKLQFV